MFFDRLKMACVQKGTSPTALLKMLGMSTSSVTSWKRGVEPAISTVYKLAEALDVDPLTLLDSKEVSEENKKAPILTGEDECDVARDLEAFVSKLEAGGAIMFDGDPLSPEARDSIISAMRLGLEAAKAANRMKQK